MKNKILVFDLHGTLIGTMEAFAETASRLIAFHYGVPKERARALYLETSGLPFFQQLDVIFPGNSINKQVAETYERTKGDSLTPRDLAMDPGEKAVLKKLAKRGHRLGISSGGIQEIVDKFVADCDVPFVYALGYQDGFDKGKAHFDHILEKEKGVPEDIILVGDSLRDMQKANEYGAGFIAKLGTFKKEDFRGAVAVDHLEELLDIL